MPMVSRTEVDLWSERGRPVFFPEGFTARQLRIEIEGREREFPRGASRWGKGTRVPGVVSSGGAIYHAEVID